MEKFQLDFIYTAEAVIVITIKIIIQLILTIF
jgi:hypothetical protein